MGWPLVVYETEHKECGSVGTLGAMAQNLAHVRKHRPWYEVARSLLKDRGMTYADLAVILDVTTGTVGHWMVGRREPTLEQVQTIAKALGTTISGLCGEDFYFLTDQAEREVIDAWRHLTQEQRNLLLGMIKQAPKK